MLAQLGAAPWTMIRRPNLYITAFLISILQGVIFLSIPEILGDDFRFPLMGISIPDLLLMFGGIIMVGALYVFLHARVANNVGNGPTQSSLQLIRESLKLSIVGVAVMMSLVILGAGILDALKSTTGLVNLLVFIIFVLISALLFFALLKFTFAPSFIGKGLNAKDALAQSWSLTTGHLISTFIVILVIMILSIILDALFQAVPLSFENDWITIIISSIFMAVAGYYSATTMGLIVGEQKVVATSSAPSRHGRKK